MYVETKLYECLKDAPYQINATFVLLLRNFYHNDSIYHFLKLLAQSHRNR